MPLLRHSRLLFFGLLLIGLGATSCQKESESIVSIALHPTNTKILYVATNDAVYKSRDGGGTWERFPSFTARRVTTLAIDPLLPATIYAGTMGDAVYKSPDGGQHWLPHNVGLKEHVSFVNQFVFHPGLRLREGSRHLTQPRPWPQPGPFLKVVTWFLHAVSSSGIPWTTHSRRHPIASRL